MTTSTVTSSRYTHTTHTPPRLDDLPLDAPAIFHFLLGHLLGNRQHILYENKRIATWLGEAESPTAQRPLASIFREFLVIDPTRPGVPPENNQNNTATQLSLQDSAGVGNHFDFNLFIHSEFRATFERFDSVDDTTTHTHIHTHHPQGYRLFDDQYLKGSRLALVIGGTGLGEVERVIRRATQQPLWLPQQAQQPQADMAAEVEAKEAMGRQRQMLSTRCCQTTCSLCWAPSRSFFFPGGSPCS